MDKFHTIEMLMNLKRQITISILQGNPFAHNSKTTMIKAKFLIK